MLRERDDRLKWIRFVFAHERVICHWDRRVWQERRRCKGESKFVTDLDKRSHTQEFELLLTDQVLNSIDRDAGNSRKPRAKLLTFIPWNRQMLDEIATPLLSMVFRGCS